LVDYGRRPLLPEGQAHEPSSFPLTICQTGLNYQRYTKMPLTEAERETLTWRSRISKMALKATLLAGIRRCSTLFSPISTKKLPTICGKLSYLSRPRNRKLQKTTTTDWFCGRHIWVGCGFDQHRMGVSVRSSRHSAAPSIKIVSVQVGVWDGRSMGHR
jgi:hypothetical protein